MNNFFRALNDPTRREILEMLKAGDMTAGDIADSFDMTKPSISHHLDLLKQADLVFSVKKGQFIYYSLNMTVMDEIMSWFMQFRPATKSFEETLPVKPKIRLQLNLPKTENED
jgi:ArsR family transcriptional regulator, arsenate/arsenite/antimonite-responsive transcriptional repressor